MNPNTPNKSKEIDPRFYHREKFVRTLEKIKHKKHLAAQAFGHTKNAPSRGDFASFAGKFSAETADRDEKMYGAILATLPGMVDASRVLADDAPTVSGSTRRQAVMDTIPFNNSLRSAIEANPRIQKEALLTIAKTAGQFYQYSAADINAVESQTRDTLRGMQHELAFESVLWNLPEGFDVLETTDEDDARGADYKVECPNGSIVRIDVKASQAAADRAIEKRTTNLARIGRQIPRNEITLFSGFSANDFDPSNPWRPTYDATNSLTPYVERVLRVASGETVPEQHTSIAK